MDCFPLEAQWSHSGLYKTTDQKRQEVIFQPGGKNNDYLCQIMTSLGLFCLVSVTPSNFYTNFTVKEFYSSHFISLKQNKQTNKILSGGRQ